MRLLDGINNDNGKQSVARRKSEARGSKRGRSNGSTRRTQALPLALEQMESRTLLSAGALDTTFGGGTGMVLTDFAGGLDQAYAMVTLDDGKMLVAGRASNGFDLDFALARYNADGSLDTTFGVNGLVTTNLGSTQDIAYAMAVQADGKIVLAGQTQRDATSFDFALVRYDADGSLDGSFGTGGVVVADFHGLLDVAYDVAIDALGNVVVAGTASDVNYSYRIGVMRFDASGAPDASFDADGKAVIVVPEADGVSLFDTEAYALEVAADGKLVLGGYAFSFNTFEANALLVRLNPDGSLDTTFGVDAAGDGARDGYRTIDFAFDGETIHDLIVLSSGEVIVAGDAFGDLLVARFTADGDLDGSFAGGGAFLLDLAFMSDSARSLAVDDAGRIYAAGFMQSDMSSELAVVRLNADGSADAGFGSGGLVLTDLGGMNDDQAMAVSLNGDTLTVAGFSYNANGGTDYDFALARYITTGADTNVAPVANPGGPYAVNEGADVTLDGSASGDSDGVIVSYEWDLDYDGVNFDADATGVSTTFSAAGLDGAAVRSIALRVTDDKGASHVYATTVDVLNVAPVVSAGDDQAVVEGGSVTLSGSASDAGGDTLTYSWTVSASNGQVIESGTGLSFGFTPVDDGTYAVTFTATDDDGASASDTVVVTVTNAAPVADAGNDLAVNEGSALTLTGSFSDAGGADTHSFLWQVVASNGQVIADGTGSSFGFTPVDNGTYTVTLTVTDDDGGSHSDTVVVTANNVAPTVLVAGDASGVRGQARSFMGGFTDPGALDTHYVRWDFGDGTTTAWQPVTDPNLQASHVWTATGTYTVTLSIKDKDGAVSSDTYAVNIKVYEFQQHGDGFALVVGGTTGNDAIEFVKSQKHVALYVNNTYHGTFNHSGRVIAFGQAGDDRISAFGIDNDALFYGGAGNDSLTGGKGNDTLFGDAGADVFDGMQGTNTIHRDAEDPTERGGGRPSAASVRETLNIVSSRLRKGSPLRAFRF